MQDHIVQIISSFTYYERFAGSADIYLGSGAGGSAAICIYHVYMLCMHACAA